MNKAPSSRPAAPRSLRPAVGCTLLPPSYRGGYRGAERGVSGCRGGGISVQRGGYLGANPSPNPRKHWAKSTSNLLRLLSLLRLLKGIAAVPLRRRLALRPIREENHRRSRIGICAYAHAQKNFATPPTLRVVTPLRYLRPRAFAPQFPKKLCPEPTARLWDQNLKNICGFLGSRFFLPIGLDIHTLRGIAQERRERASTPSAHGWDNLPKYPCARAYTRAYGAKMAVFSPYGPFVWFCGSFGLVLAYGPYVSENASKCGGMSQETPQEPVCRKGRRSRGYLEGRDKLQVPELSEAGLSDGSSLTGRNREGVGRSRRYKGTLFQMREKKEVTV